ncbi:MAG: hypothetical protein KatS3mg076_0505 [Candidatus Binatia bacterium]|nr:MAG: hypothetical protein KatS3mg076_0505 [Candidatus Binatia bacterium]
MQTNVFVSLAITLFLALPAPSSARLRLFVPNSGDDTVSVIDGDEDREVAVLEVGAMPQAVALRPDPPLLAVANSRGNSVTLVDPVELRVLGDPIPAGRFPVHLTFSADGRFLFSSAYDDDAVHVIDVVARTLSGDPIRLPARARRLLLTPRNELLALVYAENGVLALLDLEKRVVAKTVGVGKAPTDLVLAPDGKHIWVAAFQSDTLSLVDLETFRVRKTFDASVGNGLVLDPFRHLLYSIDTFENRVWVFDYEKGEHAGDIPVGEDPVYSAMTPDGRYLYVVNSTDGNLTKVDLESRKFLRRIAVGTEPIGIVVFELPRAPYRGILTALAAAVVILFLFGVGLRGVRKRKKRH